MLRVASWQRDRIASLRVNELTNELAAGEKMINAKLMAWIHKSALLVSLMILIFAVGCGPEPTAIIIILPTATGSPTPIPEPTETETPAPTPTPVATTFVPTAVIKIFSHIPLSGDQAIVGQDILQGAELAVQQLSGPLSDYRFKVELVPYDDQNSVGPAAANAQQIIADPEILCGIGHYDPNVTIATSNIYHQAGLAFVAPSVTDPLLTDRDYLEVNRLIGHRDGQGAAAAQFATAQEFTSVYIISQPGESSLRNAEYFRLEADRRGIQTLGMIVTEINSQNTDKFVGQIITVKPELVYISSSAEQALPFLNALRAAGYMGAILGTELLNDPSISNLADLSLIEGAGMYYTITNPPVEYFSDAARFMRDFEAQYGTLPLSFAARAYDATGVCLKAIERATKAKNGMLPTRAEVAKSIRRMKDYQGLTGNFDFNNRGDPDLAQYYIVHITSLDPANWDQNSIVASYEIAAP
jgi:branched-chain amino acid transport system substrate-binding protein